MSLSRPVSRRKLSSAATASISVRVPRAASRSNQARKRVTAAPSRMRLSRAGNLDLVLHGLHQRNRAGPACGLAAEYANRVDVAILADTR